MRPLVGITCYVEPARWGPWDVPAALLPVSYVRAVDAAGARPVIVPPVEDGVEEALDALHALVLAGGADIDPSLYGAARHPRTTGFRPDRDHAELELIGGALERGMPVLGVCRGMQLLNVVRGGDLVQDVADARLHKQAAGVFARHDVTIEPASALGDVLGDRTLVPSHHHQAPGRIGRGLRASAWAPDATVEGIEDLAGGALGILWHPEEGDDAALFGALVERARRYRRSRVQGEGVAVYSAKEWR